MPRPTRTLRCREPRAGFRLERFTAIVSSIRFFHSHKVADFQDHTANRRVIRVFHHLIHAAKTQPADRLPHVLRAGDKTSHPLDFQNSRCFLRHNNSYSRRNQRPSSSTVFERSSATLAMSFRRNRASKVALMTLCGFDVPIDFVSTLEIPATSITARTGPPAIIPVPSGAGFSITWPEPYKPRTWCGIVVPFKFR